MYVKFVYSEKATKFFEIFPLLLSAVHTDKSKGKISQNFVAFSEYMNFTVNTTECSKASFQKKAKKIGGLLTILGKTLDF